MGVSHKKANSHYEKNDQNEPQRLISGKGPKMAVHKRKKHEKGGPEKIRRTTGQKPNFGKGRGEG